MSLAKISGQLFIDIDGTDLTASDIDLLKHPKISGVVLFKKNFIDSAQLKNLCKKIHSVKKELVISVDHEGGAVQRFQKGFTILPPINELSELAKTDIDQAMIAAKKQGAIMANDLVAHGVDACLGPVLDCFSATANNNFYKRCFSDDPKLVIKLAASYLSGMANQSMLAIGKHFPGHGFIDEDTHHLISRDYRTIDELMNHDILPYIALKSSIQGIMLSHIIFPDMDDLPCSLSAKWVKFIRANLNFPQILITDCLSMKAVADLIPNPAERVAQVFAAGVDVAIFCNDRLGVEKALNEIPAVSCNKINTALQKWKIAVN
jgi:beta-N-acetylhexosaminidase